MNFGSLTTDNVTSSLTNLSLQAASGILYVKNVKLIWTAAFHNAFYLKMLLSSWGIFFADRERNLFELKWIFFFFLPFCLQKTTKPTENKQKTKMHNANQIVYICIFTWAI